MTGAALTKFGRAPRTCVIMFSFRSSGVLNLTRHAAGEDDLLRVGAGLAACPRRSAARAPAGGADGPARGAVRCAHAVPRADRSGAEARRDRRAACAPGRDARVA